MAGAALQTPLSGTLIGSRRLTVGRLVIVRPTRGAKRQIFCVQLRRFDNHIGLCNEHARLIGVLGSAMKAIEVETSGDLNVVVSDAVEGRALDGTAPPLSVANEEDHRFPVRSAAGSTRPHPS